MQNQVNDSFYEYDCQFVSLMIQVFFDFLYLDCLIFRSISDILSIYEIDDEID